MIESKTERERIYSDFQQYKESTNAIEGWLETHPIQFSIRDLSAKLGVKESFCKKIVESSPIVKPIYEAMGRPGPQKRYVSVAIPPAPTLEGANEVFNLVSRAFDTLGREARADYYELIRIRSLSLHQGKRRF